MSPEDGGRAAWRAGAGATEGRGWRAVAGSSTPHVTGSPAPRPRHSGTLRTWLRRFCLLKAAKPRIQVAQPTPSIILKNKTKNKKKPELVPSYNLSLVKTRGRILKAAGRRRSESSLTADFSAATAEPTRQRGDVFTPLEGNNGPRDVRVPTARTWDQLALHGSRDAAAVMGVRP